MVLLAVAALASAPEFAWSSSSICGANILTTSCKGLPDDHEWSVGEHPTFALVCYGCNQTTPDAAPVPCSELTIDLRNLSMKVGEETFGRGEFVDTGITCPVYAYAVRGMEGKLIKYVGPLRAGTVHTIHYPMSYSPSTQIARFTVKAQDPSSTPADASPDRSSVDATKDVAADAAVVTATPVKDKKGGGCTVGNGGGGGLSSAGIGVLLMLARRRRSPYADRRRYDRR